jgi:hypothetical protein
LSGGDWLPDLRLGRTGRWRPAELACDGDRVALPVKRHDDVNFGVPDGANLFGSINGIPGTAAASAGLIQPKIAISVSSCGGKRVIRFASAVCTGGTTRGGEMTGGNLRRRRHTAAIAFSQPLKV